MTMPDEAELNFEHTFLEVVQFTEIVEMMGCSTKEAKLMYKPGPEMDHIRCEMDFIANKSYYTGNLGMCAPFADTSKMFLGYRKGEYESKTLQRLGYTEVNAGYNWRKGQYKASFEQTLNPISGIETGFRESISRRQLGPNVRENEKKTGVVFNYSLAQLAKAPMFSGHPFIDPDNKVYLKLGRKTRTNDIDTRHASPEMIAIG